tara:strand:+ start:2536 stop:2778 length:243 start_codon:yes stop_codon:yes gene_type:complete
MKKVKIKIGITLNGDRVNTCNRKLHLRGILYEIIDSINEGDDQIVPSECQSISMKIEMGGGMGWSLFAEDWDPAKWGQIE